MNICNPLGNCQTKSVTTLIAIPRALDAIEALENTLRVIGRNANAIIGNLQNNPACSRMKSNNDAASRRSVFDSVVYKYVGQAPDG